MRLAMKLVVAQFCRARDNEIIEGAECERSENTMQFLHHHQLDTSLPPHSEGVVMLSEYGTCTVYVVFAFMTQQPHLSCYLPLLPPLGSKSFSCPLLCLPSLLLLMLELCHSLHLLVLLALLPFLTSPSNLCRPHLHTCKRRGYLIRTCEP